MSGSRQNSVGMGEVVSDRQSLATPDLATLAWLGGDADVALNERPNGSPPTTSARRLAGYEEAAGVAAKVFSDIDHLIAHVKSRADTFVTFDQGTILSRRERLTAQGDPRLHAAEALSLVR